MKKTEILELKKRFKKDDVTISKVAGCYVNADKNIVFTFNRQMLTMDDEDFFKYLDIAKKSLSGSLGNNLFNLDFPLDEEKIGGKQQSLMALRDSDLADEDMLTAYYEHVIDTYDHTGNYFIVLFLDNYDVMTKTEDKKNLDESEETFKYLICAVCPVDLSKAALGYNETMNQIKSRERDWVVGAPESAFMFPAFNDRSTDIHSTLFYSKKSRDIHTEFIENGLGCKSVMSSDEKRDTIQSTIANNIGDGADIESAILGIYIDIEKQASDNELEDVSSYRISQDTLEKTLDDNGMPDTVIKAVKEVCNEIFPDGEIWGSDIVDEKYMKKNKLLIDYKELAAENARLGKELDKKYSAEELKHKFSSYTGENDIKSFLDYIA